MITRTFTIDPINFGDVKKRLEKLANKANKLGIPVPEITETKEYKVKREYVNEYGYKVIEYKKKMDITVSGEEIRYGKYTHVASLDHTISNKPIVKVIPGYTIPEKYQDADCNCDHCHVNRYRKNTYVFVDNTGEYKQVGSTCLKEFFGIDPTDNLNYFQSFYDISEWNDDMLSGNYSPIECDNKTILAVALNVVSEHGYISKKMGMEKGIESTASIVEFYLFPPKFGDEDYQSYKTFMEKVYNTLNGTDVDNLIAWGINHFATQDGEYAHNMRIFLNTESIPIKYIGYLVSVIAAFNRENVAKNTAKTSDNQFIGNIKDKIEVAVTVNKIIPVYNAYGESFINIMTQKETGNTIVWVSSNNVLTEGTNIVLKGTVKDHKVRDNKNQTILTRCKLV